MFPRLKLCFLAAIILVSCSVLKTDSGDKDVLAFLSKFKSDLKLPSQKLVTLYFSGTNQSRETLIEALEVLKNRDSVTIQCTPHFESPSIVRYPTRIQVAVPVTFTTSFEGQEITKEAEFILWLERPHEEFVIAEVEGEKFYQGYLAAKNEREWAAERKIELEKREPIYALAQSLEQKFDSVIWYAQYRDSLFFYAVSGTWNNYFMQEGEEAPKEYKMGLINSAGDTLIPFEYDFIGTLGFTGPGLVEVRHDGKYGYFNLDSGKLVVDTEYDIIIPYNKKDEPEVWALVSKDTVNGWIDNNFVYYESYPSEETQDYAQNFKYLKEAIVLKVGNQTFCEIPSREHVGFGIILPPSYYVKNNLFPAIVGGINTTKVPMNGWTDYIEAKNSFVNRIGDNIRALISVLQERYIGGREEFYGSSQVTFVDENDEVLTTTEMPTDQEIIFTHVDDFTIELMAASTDYHYYPPGNERDIPVYKYFRMSEGALTEVESNRMFPFTEFVKIDSSYLEGSFSIPAPYKEEVVEDETVESEEVDDSAEQEEESGEEETEAVEEEYYEEYEEDSYTPIYFLTLATLEYMRDEILAANGYQPLNSSNSETLRGRGFLQQNNAFNGDTSVLNDIDKHNYEFLTCVIDLVKESESQDEPGV